MATVYMHSMSVTVIFVTVAAEMHDAYDKLGLMTY